MKRLFMFCVLSLLAVVTLSVVAEDKKVDDLKTSKQAVGIEILHDKENPAKVVKGVTDFLRYSTNSPYGSTTVRVSGDALKLSRHGRVALIGSKYLNGSEKDEFEFSVEKVGKARIVINTKGRTISTKTIDVIVED